MSNPTYLEEMLKASGLEECNPAKTPLSKEVLMKIATEVQAENFLTEDEKKQHQSDIGGLLWLAQTTHPCLATAVSVLAKWNACPTPSCRAGVKQIKRFAAGLVGSGITFESKNQNKLEVFSDADLAGLFAVTGDTHSRMGLLATYNGIPIQWVSKTIKGVVTSSCDAEVYALSEAVRAEITLMTNRELAGAES